MNLFKWLAEIIVLMEGFVPESMLIFFISVFFTIVALFKKFYSDKMSPDVFRHYLNTFSWVTMSASSTVYFFLVLESPYHFETHLGFKSDIVIYLFRISFMIVFLFYFLYVYADVQTHNAFTYEYYFLLVTAMLGLNMMTISGNFLNLLLAIELYSISVVYLIYYKRQAGLSVEASFKYFAVSSFATAVYIFGVFYIYLAVGSFDFGALDIIHVPTTQCAVGYFFILMSLIIKIGGGIFFFWIVDAYEGASYPILMFLNIFVKPVFIVVIFKTLIVAGHYPIFWIIKTFLFSTVLVGSVAASTQTKIKRFLIFMSLYNIGFLTCFFWEPSCQMLGGFVFFFSIYALNSLALFILFASLKDSSFLRRGFLVVDLKDLSSIMPQNKAWAWAFIFFLFVMSGLPPFAFFFAKYYLFFKFSQIGIIYVFILLLSSAIATFNYIRIIRIILTPTDEPTFFFRMSSLFVASLIAFLTSFNICLIFWSEDILFTLNELISTLC